MALSGVNQSHVQPLWEEIPSRPANIGAMPRLFAVSPTDITGNLSALPTKNLPDEETNFRLLGNIVILLHTTEINS